MKVLLLALSSSLLVTASAFADAGSAAKPTATKPADKIVCKRQETIGTRLGGKRICKPASEWRETTESHKEALDSAQRNTMPIPN